MVKCYLFKRVIALIALSLYAWSTMYTNSACVIIHGTWASSESWYTARGDFFKSVARCAQELKIVDEVIPFSWSGKLGYASQLEAAQDLATIVDQYDWVILIGHSHGVTVGILCSIIVGQKNSDVANSYKIAKFYALGVPVDLTRQIYPDMSVVGKFYNLFSFGDYIQTVNGAHERCFAPHQRLVNLAILIHDDHPSHSQLHHPIIGKDILKIEEYFARRCLGNFENFCCNTSGQIIFSKHDLPQYKVQEDQKSLLELDKKALWLMTMTLFRGEKFDDEPSSF